MEGTPATEESKQWPQIIAVTACLILAVSTGLQSGWPSPAIPKLEDKELQFEVNDVQASNIVMLYPLGWLFSPICTYLLDKIGRKYLLLSMVCPQIFAWLLVANATNVYMLYIARIIGGMAEGGVFAAMPVYICEVAEAKVRGRLGMGYSTAFVFGFFLINCYGSYMPIRTSAYVSISLPLLFFITFMWMPESPYFFLMKGNPEHARSSLKKLRRMNDVEEELKKLTSDVQRQISEPSSVKDVFTIKSNLMAFLIIIGLRTLQQYSGGASVIYYNQVIFRQAGGHISHAESAIIFNGALFIVSTSGLLMVDKYGRRPLLMWSVGGTVLCLLAEAVYFTLQYYKYDLSNLGWLPVTGMIFYTIVRGVGLLSIPTLMAGELFSASVKGKAMGLVNIYVALCMSLTSKLFKFLERSYGMHVPFFLFVFGAIVGLFFIYFCVPETKGKTLEEIQQHLKENVKN